jgi:hypothetical protein
MTTGLVLASALDSPAVTVTLVIVFSALIVVLLTAVASAVLWAALWAADRYRGLPNA